VQSDDLEWLLAVLRYGSLSAAAKVRGVAVSTAARRLAALEASLGIRLIDRRMNGSRLTAAGERIAALAEPAVEARARIARAAAAIRDGDGREAVRVSATEFIVSDVLAPALHLLWKRHPEINIVLRAQADVVSLAGRNADIAVRMAQPEGNSLIAKKLKPLRIGLFASEAYLAGRAVTAANLGQERLLVYDDSYGRLPELDWITTIGLDGAVALRTGSTRALLTAAISGVGIALLPASFARLESLVEIELPLDLPNRTPWIVVHQDLKRDRIVRRIHAWIIEAFHQIG
jgi:DNA-binding transcriptional LysR family regulator